MATKNDNEFNFYERFNPSNFEQARAKKSKIIILETGDYGDLVIDFPTKIIGMDETVLTVNSIVITKNCHLKNLTVKRKDMNQGEYQGVVALSAMCKCTDVSVIGFEYGVSALNGAIISLLRTNVSDNMFADDKSKIFQSTAETLLTQIFVSQDNKFEAAVNSANGSNKVTIFLGQGTFKTYYTTIHGTVKNLKITKQMNIIGVKVNQTILKCGIEINPDIQECLIKNLTIEGNIERSQSGVVAKSSVRMENVVVQNFEKFGVYVQGTDTDITGMFVNVTVQNCGWSGITAENTTITLIETETTRNGSKDVNAYGLVAIGSIVKLAQQLEDVTHGNIGKRNLHYDDSEILTNVIEIVGNMNKKLRFL
jgi:hypothetical protein